MFRIQTIGRGFLAIMPYPGREQDAAVEMAELAGEGVGRIVSLLEPSEAAALGLEHENQLAAAESIDFVSYPIPDMGLPASPQGFASLARDLYRQIDSGDNTLLHCRGGIGRSGLLAAAILFQTGMDTRQACAHISRQRGCRVPETPQQGEWLVRNRDLVTAAQGTG